MNRRDFVKAFTGAVAASLILPELPERRFWQLDQTMAKEKPIILYDAAFYDFAPGQVIELKSGEDREYIWWDGGHVHRGQAGSTEIRTGEDWSLTAIGIAIPESIGYVL